MLLERINCLGVAVVGGASRGIGKGIAIELGRAGYTVYCIGRSRGDGLSIDTTVKAIEESAGQGIPLGIDLMDDERVLEAAEEIKRRHGCIDLLVCSTFAVPDADPAEFRNDFWTQGMQMWDACHGAGLRAYYSLMCACVPLMSTAKERPLIALISSFGGKSYTFNVAYGVGKAAVDRLAADAAIQLSPYGIDVISLYPGVVRTERNLELEASGKWKQASGGLDLSCAESPSLSGKALLALLDLPLASRSQLSGSVQVVAEIAKEFAIKDNAAPKTRSFASLPAGGGGNDHAPPILVEPPPSIRSLRFIIPNFLLSDAALEDMELPAFMLPLVKTFRANVPDILLPWSVFSSGPPPVSNVNE